MYVDARAIIAMIAGEPQAEKCEAALAKARDAFTSPLAAFEAIMLLSRKDQLDCSYKQAELVVTEWLAARNIELRNPASPARLLSLAVSAAQEHGVGRKALTSFDCFHYAYAKAARRPLMTLESRLRETDVEAAP